MAILLVLIAHSTLALGAPSHIAWLQMGGTGVDLFFVLSGWLLGGHLFKELDRTGTVDIRRFWRRRWLRTLPAYFAVLGLTVLQLGFTQPGFQLPFEYAFFAQNYTGLSIFHVSWSLCVEEHFYLLVAPSILLAARYRKLIAPLLVAVLVIPAGFRFCELYGSIKQTHVRLDGCAMGVILAMIANYRPAVWKRLTSNANRIVAVALLVYVSNLFTCWCWQRPWFTDSGWFCWLSVAFVLFAVSSEKVQQELTYPGCQYVATRSYGIYLLHPDVLSLINRWGAQMPFVIYLLLAIAGSCVAAEILYRFVEAPVLAWRDRVMFRHADTEPTFAKPSQSAA